MLTHLTIRNFALVETLQLELQGGMTVVTGETGAGKSIMLDALGLALGDRADAGIIGQYGDKTEIVASFDIDANKIARSWLEERELATAEGDCILRRVIGKDGRSRGFINGAPSTVADLKALGNLLIDIHSQHEHQSLLKKETHQRLLDEFAGTTSLAQTVASICQESIACQQRLNDLINSSEEQAARHQLLAYQAEELNQLAIGENEYANLEEEQKRLANAESILSSCNTVLGLCQQDADDGAQHALSKSVQLLRGLDLEELRPITELLDSAQIQLKEGLHDLERFVTDFELDPGRLREVEERLGVIYDLCRKHRIEPGDVTTLQTDILAELESLENADGLTAQLEEELQNLRQQYLQSAKQLSTKRTRAAKKLSQQVCDQLGKLGMSGATFSIDLAALDKSGLYPRGLEDIEFLISTNAGQTPRPLNKVASGGELSRISLAIQVVTADTSDVPSLVFDEVDVGIGGAVAEVVGSLLRQLASKAQIICVTHLPQVAAQGHQHLQVSKSAAKTPKSVVRNLAPAEKIEEIARMLGGIEMTDQSLAHAEEMYKAAQV